MDSAPLPPQADLITAQQVSRSREGQRRTSPMKRSCSSITIPDSCDPPDPSAAALPQPPPHGSGERESGAMQRSSARRASTLACLLPNSVSAMLLGRGRAGSAGERTAMPLGRNRRRRCRKGRSFQHLRKQPRLVLSSRAARSPTARPSCARVHRRPRAKEWILIVRSPPHTLRGASAARHWLGSSFSRAARSLGRSRRSGRACGRWDGRRRRRAG